MFNVKFSLWPRFNFGQSSKAINIPSVKIYNIETDSDKRTRRFKHLVKLNHVNHAVLFNERRFHNHCPHILGSAYLLDAEPDHLNEIYDEEATTLDPWEDSPNEIAKHDWRDNLGKREYQRAYLDFFEDELVNNGYDWYAVVDEFLFQGKEPLVNWLVSDLGHPLIHLGYAFEVSSREICMEALTLASVCYSPMHKYIDDPSYSATSPAYQTTSPLEALAHVAADSRFDGPSAHSFSHLFSDRRLESAVLSHWNAWQISSNPRHAFEQSQKLAVGILIASCSKPPLHYDFFLLHLLTISHALRILLPLFPGKYHVSLLKQWWLITIGYYIQQGRPVIDYKEVLEYDLKGRDWAWVQKVASGQAQTAKDETVPPPAAGAAKKNFSLDAHYVKGLRAMKVAAETWGDDDEFYLRAAVRFADEFSGWGFGSFDEEGETTVD